MKEVRKDSFTLFANKLIRSSMKSKKKIYIDIKEKVEHSTIQ